MITNKTKHYLEIKINSIEEQKSLIIHLCIQLVNKFTEFQGTENSDKFKDAIEFYDNDLNNALSELSKMDSDSYDEMISSKDYERVDDTLFDILCYPPYYYPILNAMGEEWFKHEAGIFGIDYNKIQKKVGKKPKWM